MTKQYKFIVLVWIFLIVLYLVLAFKYEQYKVKQAMDEIAIDNLKLKDSIDQRREFISYKSSKAYKNRILKEQEGLKSKGETVLYITTQADYEKYTAPYKLEISEVPEKTIDPELEGLTNIEKWERFLFGR